MSEIRDETASRWDFDRYIREQNLSNPFFRGISFADTDIEIEINSHFLNVEGKRTGKELLDGQNKKMIAASNDGRTCVAVWGNPDTGEIVEMQTFYPNRRFPATMKDFINFCHHWAVWADQQRRPKERLHLCFTEVPCP